VSRSAFANGTNATGFDEIPGALKGETAEELIVQDAVGNRHHLRKTDIKERRASAVSLMPDGLQVGLSLQDFTDMVSFLEALKSKASGAISN